MAVSKRGKGDPAATKPEEIEMKGVFKLAHIKRILRKTNKRSSRQACAAVSVAVYVMMKEVILGAIYAAEQDGKRKILPRHINLAIHKDGELSKLGYDILIRSGGVNNIIPAEMLKKKHNERG